jgi:acyl-CoA hydrolase
MAALVQVKQAAQRSTPLAQKISYGFIMNTDFGFVSAQQALSVVQPGNRVFIQGSAQTPTFLINELAKQAGRLTDVELVFISVYGPIEVLKPQYVQSFHINSLFVSATIRSAVNDGQADYVPVFLSEIPHLFEQSILPIDVALIHVSPPDAHGFCSLGLSVDIARSAVYNAKYVIAQINPNVPRTHGDGLIHCRHFQAMVACNDPLHEASFNGTITTEEAQIGTYVANLIEDRSTLQMGIGSIPNAVLQSLTNHKDLGVHTEMCSDGILELIEKNIITNKYKHIHPNKIVTAFALGTKKLYEYINDNPFFQFLDIGYVNDPHVIRRNSKMVAINSAIEIDVTGQICADTIGTYQYSGVGGQMDFMRGAALSEGGKPVIAIASRTDKGIGRIVATLKTGANVVTTRAHVHYVVTEYGVANLYGKNLRQRAKALIAIAHPDDREELEKACYARFRVF